MSSSFLSSRRRGLRFPWGNGALAVILLLLLVLCPSSFQRHYYRGSSSSSPSLIEFRHHRSTSFPNESSWEWTAHHTRNFLFRNGKSRSQCLYSTLPKSVLFRGDSSSSKQQLSSPPPPYMTLRLVTNWINRLCSLPEPRERLETLLSRSPCSGFDICQFLRPEDIKDIIGSDHSACFRTVEKWWKAFHNIKNILDDFNLLLPSFDSSPYSVEYELDQCKIAYGFWICSESLPLYLTSMSNNRTMSVSPCHSACRDVERSCPFLIRGTEDDKAAGNPSFLCRDENVPPMFLEEASPPSNCCYERIKDPPPGSWRSIKKSSFSDPTSSCLSLAGDDGSTGGTWDGVSPTAEEELNTCDSFYFLPPNLNVSFSEERREWKEWTSEGWREEELSHTLRVLHHQFNVEEIFLNVFASSSSSLNSSSSTVQRHFYHAHSWLFFIFIITLQRTILTLNNLS